MIIIPLCTQYESSISSIDWSLVREVVNFFPEVFLAIIEDNFPLALSNFKCECQRFDFDRLVTNKSNPNFLSSIAVAFF